jgi:hypothetical protein
MEGEMSRKMYEPTENQERKWSKFDNITMPTDEEFKTRAKRERKPWGILKRDFVLSQMTRTREYQIGIWQGRVDRARGLDYGEERNENTYNLGYYRGYTQYDSDRRGWDANTRQRFNKYVEG